MPDGDFCLDDSPDTDVGLSNVELANLFSVLFRPCPEEETEWDACGRCGNDDSPAIQWRGLTLCDECIEIAKLSLPPDSPRRAAPGRLEA